MKEVTGTIYIRNAIKYDFCVVEAIKSLAPICDKIICLDCCSTDSTYGLLREVKYIHAPGLKIVRGVDWCPEKGYHQLRYLSDLALSYVKSKWRLHIQADEVLHHSSYKYIIDFIRSKEAEMYDSCTIQRVNLFGSFKYAIKRTMPNAPCGNRIIRLAKTHIKSAGDDESLIRTNNVYEGLYKYVKYFHYSYLRKPEKLLNKSINMQSWFHQNKDAVDIRLLEARERKCFDPYKFIKREDLIEHNMEHPYVALDWVNERKKYYKES